MKRTITIQPGQPGEGMDYNVNKPLPYPFHIDAETGDCTHGRGTDRCDGVLPGRMPWRLIGFQLVRDVQEVDLLVEDFVVDPTRAVGMFPVFIHEGDIFNLETPITNVSVTGEAVSA